MSKHNWAQQSVYGLLLTATLATANPLPAVAQESHRFAVESTNAARAIQEFGTQSRLQILASAEQLEGKRLQPVSGTLSTDDALKTLLAGTGLSHRYVGERTVALVGQEERASGRMGEDAESGMEDQVRVAQTQESSATAGAEPVAQESANAGALAGNESEREIQMLDEVLVTAQKREERLQDVPISISVLSGNDLDRSTAQGISDALSRVPGVSVAFAGQGGGTQLAVRGVTAGGALFNGSSPIGYYLDSVPFGLIKTAVVPDANPYDLERVEVLRGPQGTLYGASAQNGVVRILTHDADLNDFEIKARTSVSSTDGGGGNYRADMAVNLPIIEDKLAARLVAGYEDWSGWISRPHQRNANDGTVRNMRLKVNAKPFENLSIGASAWFLRSDYGAPAMSANGSTNPVTQFDESISTDYDVLGLKLGYTFSGFSVESTTSYIDYENTGDLDLFALGLDSLFTGLYSKVFAQEINVNSAAEGAWRWSFGGIYRDGEDRLIQTLPLFIPAPIDFYDVSKSSAVYGQLTRILWDGKLEIAAGLRHFEDDVTNGEHIRYCGSTCPGTALYRRDSTFDANSPRLVATWHPTEQATFYASYAEGFRSGFNQNANAAILPPLEADTLKNYELGTKGRALNGLFSYEAAIYYIDWQDVQQTLAIIPAGQSAPVTGLVNGQSASGVGAEFVVTIEPFDNLQLDAGLNWNDLTMDEDVHSNGELLISAGDRLNVSPEYTALVSLNYKFPLGSAGLQGSFAISGNYVSERGAHTLLAGVGGEFVAGDSILTSRASFAVDSGDRWTASIFIENANSDTGPISRGGPVAPVWSIYGRPRTAGLQFEYRLGHQ